MTVTPLPTLTSTALPATGTPGQVPTLTPTALVSLCPDDVWHEPIDAPGCHHHHGFNPRAQEFKTIFNIDGFNIDEWLDKYGELLQPDWMTFNENPIGAIWLYSDAGASGCILDFEGIMRGCEYKNGQADQTKCGISAGGAQPFYSIMHSPYKKDLCHLPIEPAGYPDSQLDQPPYRTAQIEPPRDGFIQQYWVNSDINPTVQEFYTPGTNWLFNSAWLAMDVWQVFPVDLVCDKSPAISIDTIKALLSQVPPTLADAHKTFKINDITLRAHPPGPFEGWFDPFGGACDEADNVCLPLFISPNFPDKPVTLHRGAEPSDCGPNVENPCIVIDTNNVIMIFPPYDVPAP